ncbi:MAG: tyrosine-protein phosphatase, partial [Clostridia bacterium]|nr:tyrosine-protein phosphatase [Clostridia bacterium]
MIQNMRDLGGTPVKDGRSIRPGMLVRSAQLSLAEENDLRGIAS